jgi:hypothetical protein
MSFLNYLRHHLFPRTCKNNEFERQVPKITSYLFYNACMYIFQTKAHFHLELKYLKSILIVRCFTNIHLYNHATYLHSCNDKQKLTK